MVGKEEIDLTQGDYSPDLIIEIEVSNPSMAKFPVYSRMGIPEVWRQSVSGAVSFYYLERGEYLEVDTSVALPNLAAVDVNRLLQEGRTLPHNTWLRREQTWAREKL